MDNQEDVLDTPAQLASKEVTASYQLVNILAVASYVMMIYDDTQGFKIDHEDCTFGQIMAKGKYKPRSNFIMELETYVEAGSNTGFIVWVTRRSDHLKK